MLNVVTGKSSVIGAVLTASPTVRALSFTGSTEIGRLLMAQCAGTIKRLALELGGNAPFLVFDDADLDAAVAGALASKYRHSGQTCVCANRFLVQAGIYDAFAARLAERTSATVLITLLLRAWTSAILRAPVMLARRRRQRALRRITGTEWRRTMRRHRLGIRELALKD